MKVFGRRCDRCVYVPLLTAGNPYFTRVRSRNTRGFSDSWAVALDSSASPVATKPAAIPGACQDVTLAVQSSSELEVLWAPPSGDVGEPVDAYIIQWHTDNTFGDKTESPLGQVELKASGLTSLTPPSASSVTPKYSYTIADLSGTQAYFVRCLLYTSPSPRDS